MLAVVRLDQVPRDPLSFIELAIAILLDDVVVDHLGWLDLGIDFWFGISGEVQNKEMLIDIEVSHDSSELTQDELLLLLLPGAEDVMALEAGCRDQLGLDLEDEVRV